MSSSNDALTQMLLMQARQNRQPSTQARLAQQMMQANMQQAQTPVWGTGATLARAGSGVLAGLMAGVAERNDQRREDEMLAQIQNRQDEIDTRNRQELAAFLGGGAPVTPQQAPQMPMQGGGGMAPAMGAAPRGDATDAVTQGIAARRALAPNSPTYAEDIQRINNGVVASPGVLPGMRPQPISQEAAPQARPDAMTMYQMAVSSPNPLIARMAPGFLAQANRDDVRANRPPQIVAPGSTVLDPQTMRPVFTAPRAPEAPSEFDRLVAAAGLQPGSPEAQAFARDRLARLGMPPQTNVSVDNRAESALMRADTNTLKAVNEGVNQALSLRNVFDRAGQAIRAAPEGQGAQLAPFLGQAARTLGMDIPGTSEAEVLRSLTNQLASLQRIPGSGATTDTDMRLFLQSVPRLGNTREGNVALLDMGRRLAERRIEEARIWRQHVGQPDLIDRLNALPPIFRDDEREMLAGAPPQPAPQPGGVAGPGGMTMEPPQGMPRVNSPADAMRLPPGTRFMGPDGRVREVPAR